MRSDSALDVSETMTRMATSTEELLRGIVERQERNTVVLSPADGRCYRKVVYVNSYGGPDVLRKIRSGLLPPQHMWGCFELVRRGYEVALPDALLDFSYRDPLPHDLKLLRLVHSWLPSDGIVYCGHNVLFWLPSLRRVRGIHARVVSLLFAREPLKFARAHSGIVGLTRAGAEHASRLAPGVRVANLSWGADLSAYPRLPYRPECFFSCGIAVRDFDTLSRAAARSNHRIDVVVPGNVDGVQWPSNVSVFDGGSGWSFQKDRFSHRELIQRFQARSVASLIILKRDDAEYIACGFTELIDAMAMARPVIMTRTGALPTEIDIEKAGFGIYVPPEDPDAIVEAMNYLRNNPDAAEEMGQYGRLLAEQHYNLERYATDLHSFFENL